MRNLFVAGMCVCTMASGTAAYADGDGFYGRIGAGVAFGEEMTQSVAHDPDVDFVVPPPEQQSFNPNTGFAAGAALGVLLGAGFRSEAEYRFTTNSVDKLRFFGGVEKFSDSVDDSISAHSFFANVLYDFPSIESVEPFIGAGIGASRVKSLGGDDDIAIAYQFKAGIFVPLSSTSGFTLDYSYARTGELELGPRTFSESRARIISDSDAFATSVVSLSYQFRL